MINHSMLGDDIQLQLHSAILRVSDGMNFLMFNAYYSLVWNQTTQVCGSNTLSLRVLTAENVRVGKVSYMAVWKWGMDVFFCVQTILTATHVSKNRGVSSNHPKLSSLLRIGLTNQGCLERPQSCRSNLFGLGQNLRNSRILTLLFCKTDYQHQRAASKANMCCSV